MKAGDLPLLAEGYLSGTLTGTQREALAMALAGDAALLRDFVSQLRQAQAIDAALRERSADKLIERVQYLIDKNRESQAVRTISAVERRLPRRRRTRRAPARWVFGGIAAAAAALILMVVLRSVGAPGGPTLIIAEGRPQLLRAEVETTLADETTLRSGDRIRCDARSAATLRWPGEETSIALAPGSDVTIGDGAAGKRLRLDAGRLDATVAKQAQDRPLMIATPRADVRVVGTRFDLAVASDASFLQVAEGTVALLRGTTALTEVRTGGGAVVDAVGARPVGPPGDLFAGGEAAWRTTRGSWHLGDGVAALHDPDGKSARIESLGTWRDFELTCEMRATGGRTYTEIQVFDVPHAVTIHHTIDDPTWKRVRLAVRHGRMEATCDGEPLRFEGDQPLPEAGTLAFFVSTDKRLEIAHASIRDLPSD